MENNNNNANSVQVIQAVIRFYENTNVSISEETCQQFLSTPKHKALLDNMVSQLYLSINNSWEIEKKVKEEAEMKLLSITKGKKAKIARNLQPQHNMQPQQLLRLTNAKVGSDYCSIATLNNKSVTLDKVVGIEETGLRFDNESRNIVGIPSKDGTFSLTVTFLLEDTTLARTDNIELLIVPDPKSLWKDIPSDQSALFWKSDNHCSGIDMADGYIAIAASRRGRSHAQTGKCRDDDFYLQATTASGWHILAVSDGAGSAEYSREGSRLAVKCSTDLLAAKLEESDSMVMQCFADWDTDKNTETKQKLKNILYNCLAHPVYETVNAINTMAEEKNLVFKQFYTTLLIGAHKEINGKHCVFAYWRGDGALAYHIPNQKLKLFGQPDSGDYAGQTRFLDMDAVRQEDIFERVVFDAYDDFGTLMLMTDGISDAMFASDADMFEQLVWDNFWQQKISVLLDNNAQCSAEKLLHWMDFWSRGNHDDRTLAILYQRANPENNPKKKIAENVNND